MAGDNVRSFVYSAAIKRTTYSKSIAGSTVHLTDGTAWEVFVPLTGRSLLPLQGSMKVETEDVGPEKTVTVVTTGQVLKARKLRAVA